MLGYSRYAIGKWHLGLSNWDVTPLGRGFEQYRGYLNGAEEYFDHSTSIISDGGRNPLYWGYDLWNNTATADPATFNGSYSTTLFGDWAVDTIQQHASQPGAKPMYLYLAFQAVHMPLMAPQAAIDRFNASIPDPRRRTFAAMASEMDTAVGRVVDALREAKMLDNTIIVLTTDNGGPACDQDGTSYDSNCASNMPLRGRKYTITEGGVRGVGLVNSPLIAPTFRGASTDQLVQVTDWYFTLASAAIQGPGGSMSDLPESRAAHDFLFHDQPAFEEGDGRDQWAWLASGDDSKHNRTWMLHTIAPDLDGNGRAQGSLMNGTLKIVTGSYMWLGGPQAWIHTPGLNFTGAGAPKFSVTCPAPPAVDNCEPAVSPCLFDVEVDPCEHNNIAADHPIAVKALRAKLDELALSRKPDLANLPAIPAECAPQNTGGVWKVCGGSPPTVA